MFFGFVDADERQIKHKDRIKEGSAGFDVRRGQPALRPSGSAQAAQAVPEGDLSRPSTARTTSTCYFQEMEIRNLRSTVGWG